MHRWTYAAALLSLLHWASLEGWEGLTPGLINFAPLAALVAYRIWWIWLRPRPSRPA